MHISYRYAVINKCNGLDCYFSEVFFYFCFFIFFTTDKKQLQHIACKLGVGQVSPAHHMREKKRGRESEGAKQEKQGS